MHDPPPGYEAFGDSITFGEGVPDPATEAYPAVVSNKEKVTFLNRGLEGDQACDVAVRQIFPLPQRQPQTSNSVFSLLIGTNDADNKGIGPYEKIFNECQLAAVAWLAVPQQNKVLAGDPGFKSSGPGNIDGFGQSHVWTTGGAGAAASFQIDTTAGSPVYAWFVIDDHSGASYACSIDGQVAASGSVSTTPSLATGNGITRSLGFLRISGLKSGAHVITFTQTNPDSAGISVLGIGTPPNPGAQLPTVLVGTIPYQEKTGNKFGCQSDDSPCLEYIKDIKSNVELLASDGLAVKLFDTRQFMFATPAEMTDPVHPNVLGEHELAEAVMSVWP